MGAVGNIPLSSYCRQSYSVHDVNAQRCWIRVKGTIEQSTIMAACLAKMPEPHLPSVSIASSMECPLISTFSSSLAERSSLSVSRGVDGQNPEEQGNFWTSGSPEGIFFPRCKNVISEQPFGTHILRTVIHEGKVLQSAHILSKECKVDTGKVSILAMS